jgi:hypothetical protein
MGGGGGQRRPVLARAPMVVEAVVECVGVDAGVDAETFSPRASTHFFRKRNGRRIGDGEHQ